MKNIIIFSALLLTGGLALAQKATISGKGVTTMAGKDTKLTRTGTPGIPVHIAADGGFTVTVPSPEKGIYTLQGIGEFYLEPGYAVNVSADKLGEYSFMGKGAVEAGLLRNTKKSLREYLPMTKEGTGFLFTAYNVGVDTFLSQLNAFRSNGQQLISTSSSAYFKKLAGKDLDYFCLNMTDNYKLYYGVDSVKQQAFYDMLDKSAGMPADEKGKKIQKANEAMHLRKMTVDETRLIDSLHNSSLDNNDEELFRNSSEYRAALAGMIRTNMYKQFMPVFVARKEQSLIQLMVVNKNISNQYIRDYYTFTFTGDIIKMSKDPQLKDSLYKSFMASAVTPAYKADIQKIYDNYLNFADNKTAPEFLYTNVAGEKVSLKSLRGKYVYIDVWATWCGPCKAEIPHLTKLEEELADKNIKFVSLSVDVPADRGKWKRYVEENNLKGIQLIADNAFESDFVRKFNINSIPRFILIDPSGKIVAANALRPSNPELRRQLEKFN